MTHQQQEAPRIKAGGLVTVAFLKARLDEGHDHLDIFAPLVLDVLGRFASGSFTAADVQEAVAAAHGMAIPQDTLSTLLRRATRKRYLVREAGRYRLASGEPLPQPPNVAAEKRSIEDAQVRLAEALRVHAGKRGLVLASTDAALDLLFRFLEFEQVALLLGSPPDAGRPEATDRERGIIAEFIHDYIRDDPALNSVLRGMLEGLVIYHAAFLPELSVKRRDFRDLHAIFDAVLVRQAIGYEGDAALTLARETLALLRASGVRCVVLDKTLHEIQRILRMYEDKLATAEGRASLRPVPMARHFLTSRYTSADVRQFAALLEQDVVAAGFQIQTAPRHEREYTSGESGLAKRLANPKTMDELEPRVVHDVDCVAAALTLRRGYRGLTIEDARAVFVTSSPLVIQNTRLWWEEDECETGIPPLVHIRALTNLAWLKKPSLCADYKLRELVALCAAAMRPSQATWRRFLRHLEVLKNTNRLDSDEAVAVVVSAMSDRLLREAEIEENDPNDIDAATLDDVVERVKASYGAQSEERVAAIANDFQRQVDALRVERDAPASHLTQEKQSISAEYERRVAEAEAREREAARRAEEVERQTREDRESRERGLRTRARRWARGLTRSIQIVVVGLAAIGAVAILLGHPFHRGWVGAAVAAAIVTFVVLELVGVFGHLAQMRAATEVRLTKYFRDWLEGVNASEVRTGGVPLSILPSPERESESERAEPGERKA